MKKRQIYGPCPDCGSQFMTRQGFEGHVGTTRCPAFSHEDEQRTPPPQPQPDVGVGESERWKRGRVMSTGQNFFVRR